MFNGIEVSKDWGSLFCVTLMIAYSPLTMLQSWDSARKLNFSRHCMAECLALDEGMRMESRIRWKDLSDFQMKTDLHV